MDQTEETRTRARSNADDERRTEEPRRSPIEHAEARSDGEMLQMYEL